MRGAKIYKAHADDRYYARVEFGGEFLLRLDVPPFHPQRPWVGAPPYGVLNVLVTAVTPEGVAEEAQVPGIGKPERLGVGWRYAGRGELMSVYKRLRTHDVLVMPERQAEGLLLRLKERQTEKHREWREREAPQLAREEASWMRAVEKIEEQKQKQSQKQRMRE